MKGTFQLSEYVAHASTAYIDSEGNLAHHSYPKEQHYVTTLHPWYTNNQYVYKTETSSTAPVCILHLRGRII